MRASCAAQPPTGAISPIVKYVDLFCRAVVQGAHGKSRAVIRHGGHQALEVDWEKLLCFVEKEKMNNIDGRRIFHFNVSGSLCQISLIMSINIPDWFETGT